LLVGLKTGKFTGAKSNKGPPELVPGVAIITIHCDAHAGNEETNTLDNDLEEPSPGANDPTIILDEDPFWSAKVWVKVKRLWSGTASPAPGPYVHHSTKYSPAGDSVKSIDV